MWFGSRSRRRGGQKRLRSPERERALRVSLDAALDGNLETAELELTGLVRAESRDVELYLLLGRVHRERGDVGRAIRIHQNLLLRNDIDAGQRTRALGDLAEDLRQGGFLRRASATYEEARERSPRDAGLLRALVEIREQLGEHDQALALTRPLARAEGMTRSDRHALEARLWLALARSQHADGRHDEARRAVRKALARDARDVDAHLLCGELEAERGRSKAALAAWRKVPELDRRRGPEVYPRLAAAFSAVGRSRDFEDYLRRLMDRDSRDVHARLALARAQAARGGVEEALQELGRILDQDPANLPARITRGRLLLSEHRGPDSEKELGELLEVLEREGPVEGAT